MPQTPPATEGVPVAAHGAKPKKTQRHVRIIAMLNQKGGVGKTTSTVNLGAALAEAGQRVCLIDLDPQAHLTLHLGIEQDQIHKTVYDLLIDPECYASEALINARPNLDAVFSETDLAAAETELAQTDDRQTILRRKFQTLAQAYDVVILDCPPSLGLLTINALALANELFVPMQAHFLALQGVGKLLETVGLVSQSINPDLRVTGIVLCMHESQTTLAKEIVSDLDSFFEQAREQDVPWRDCRVLRPAIRRNVKLAEAPSFGKTIFDYEPECPGAHDYRALAQGLIERWNVRAPHAETSPLAAKHAPSVSSAPPRQTKPAAAPTAVIESKPQVEAGSGGPPEIVTVPPKPSESRARKSVA
jgi:chromosome partitioning protein